jgi:hypothetical protein
VGFEPTISAGERPLGPTCIQQNITTINSLIAVTMNVTNKTVWNATTTPQTTGALTLFGRWAKPHRLAHQSKLKWPKYLGWGQGNLNTPTQNLVVKDVRPGTPNWVRNRKGIYETWTAQNLVTACHSDIRGRRGDEPEIDRHVVLELSRLRRHNPAGSSRNRLMCDHLLCNPLATGSKYDKCLVANCMSQTDRCGIRTTNVSRYKERLIILGVRFPPHSKHSGSSIQRKLEYNHETV